MHPGPTDFHSMTYDADRDRFLLFGGNNGQPLGELWELSYVNPILLPPPVSLQAGGPALALAGVSLASVSRVPILQLTVPSAASLRLELFDISGRRLADRRFTPSTAGRNAIPLEEGRSLRAGIFFVRVTQAGSCVVGRVLIAP
jgi:hypothetical protein